MNKRDDEARVPLPEIDTDKPLTWGDFSVLMDSHANTRELLKDHVGQQRDLIESQGALIEQQAKFHAKLEEIDSRFTNGFKEDIIAEIRKNGDRLGGMKNGLIVAITGLGLVVIALVGVIVKLI